VNTNRRDTRKLAHRERNGKFPPLLYCNFSGTRVAAFSTGFINIESLFSRLSLNCDWKLAISTQGPEKLHFGALSLCYLRCIDAGGLLINETTLIAYRDNFSFDRKRATGTAQNKKDRRKIIRCPSFYKQSDMLCNAQIRNFGELYIRVSRVLNFCHI
jgi:hypothetical protein